jgi:predicted transcriptional regulator of viral defense system
LLVIQDDAIARRQGVQAGIDPYTMRSRVRSGRWQRLQRGVYAAFSGDPARETMLWAALLRAGPDATLSHLTAAERHGLIDEPSSAITITVPASRHPAQSKIPGVTIHRSDAILRTRHPTMLPPCTRVEDTVLDLIQVARTFDDAYMWICRAIGRRRTTADRIRQAMDARKKMRWRRELAAALGDADQGVLSVLEYHYVHRVERPHRLPQPGARRGSGSVQATGTSIISTWSTGCA